MLVLGRRAEHDQSRGGLPSDGCRAEERNELQDDEKVRVSVYFGSFWLGRIQGCWTKRPTLHHSLMPTFTLRIVQHIYPCVANQDIQHIHLDCHLLRKTQPRLVIIQVEFEDIKPRVGVCILDRGIRTEGRDGLLPL